MPSKLFGIDLRLPSPEGLHFHTSKDASHTAVTELRRPSMDNFKRPGLPHLKRHSDKKDKERSLSKDKKRADRDGTASPTPSSPLHPPKPVKLGLFMESPPALFIGPPQQSTGALISGRLQVTPTAPDVTLDSIVLFLECSTTAKRPVADRCRECLTQINDLYEWNFLSKSQTFRAAAGMAELPFSHLIPGHLPATTRGTLGTIDYSLHIRARTNAGQEIEYRRELIISRAILPSTDKNSVRIFPPTNLSLHVVLPNIVHPIGEFPVQARITGIITKREDTQTRWRLKKLTWRIEEHENAISPACAKHSAKLGGDGKGIAHEHTREIGSEEMKQGWKTDFDAGQIEGEFMAAVNPSTKPQCGIDAPATGHKVAHNLVLELVIAEEWAPNKKPHQATPTGAARVLRTQFHLNITQRAGMGLSWDDEMPPMYDDVPASPPHYPCGHTRVEEYSGDDLHEDVEGLVLTP